MRRMTIVFIDDEPDMLSAFRRLMRKEDLDIVVTTDPDEVFETVRSTDCAVVVSDQRMPGMQGTEVLEKVSELSEDTVRIILTGYADMEAALDAINRGAVWRFLTKPWNNDELRTTLRQAVERFSLVRENRRLQVLTEEQNAELRDLNKNLEDKVKQRTEKIRAMNGELQKSFAGTISVLSRLAELHSSTVGRHCQRVADLAVEVAQVLGIEGRELSHLKIAAMIHDVGKIGISPKILDLPESSLKGEQLEEYRSHAVHGEVIARMVPYLGDAPLYIRHHHEYVDGSGYPDGLTGDDIPLASRIVAAIDAYDKALNRLHYYSTATPEKALTTVYRHSGKRYDTAVVDALIDRVQIERAKDQQEIEMYLDDLTPGMVLSRDVHSDRGLHLLRRGVELDATNIANLKKHHQRDPIVDGIFVYRQSARGAA
jgi:response regulator RpfG family c-di-GMP phosphodiesterase